MAHEIKNVGLLHLLRGDSVWNTWRRVRVLCVIVCDNFRGGFIRRSLEFDPLKCFPGRLRALRPQGLCKPISGWDNRHKHEKVEL